MGSAASISSLSDGELLAGATAFYRDDPARFEALVEAAKRPKSTATPRRISSSAKGKSRIDTSSLTDVIPAGMSPESIRSLTHEVAEEVSLLRVDPPAYSKFLEEHLAKDWVSDVLFRGSDGEQYTSVEGKAAVKEVIEVLKNTAPLSRMVPNQLLEKASADHTLDTFKNDLMGHIGSDNSKIEERIQRYGVWRGQCGENIDYGNSEARAIIMHLLIDDGVPDRGHRKNLLAAPFLMVGASLGPHPRYGVCCVMDFATGMADPNDILEEDREVSCTENITDEVLEVVRSIPLDPDDLVRQIKLELKDDFVLTLRYKPTSCEAQFEYRKGRRIKTKRINWTTHKEQEKPQS